MIHFSLILNKSGRARFAKWYSLYTDEEKHKYIEEIYLSTATRPSNSLNSFEFKDYKIVYKRYSSLYFIFCVDVSDNDLAYLEFIQNIVETFHIYFGGVCELDLVFNFIKASYVYQAFDLFICAGEIRETSQARVLNTLKTIQKFN